MLAHVKCPKLDELANVVANIIHEYHKYVVVTHQGCCNHAMVQLYRAPLAWFVRVPCLWVIFTKVIVVGQDKVNLRGEIYVYRNNKIN